VGPAAVGKCDIALSRISEPGPVVEVRILFRRLYGEPGKYDAPNPYVATCERQRGSALVNAKADREHSPVGGIIDYRYWHSLELGYIENVQVGSEMRRQGLGAKLIDFAVDHMCGKDVRRVYSFAASQPGFRLLTRAGFTAEPPENPELSWKRWFFHNIERSRIRFT